MRNEGEKMGIAELKLLYDGIKGVANIVRTVDTTEAKLELYGTLLDLSSKALELQGKIQEMLDENRNLKQQIEELKKVKITEEDIEYHEHPYITLKSDKEKLRKFCANCWAEHHTLFQLEIYKLSRGVIRGICSHCKTDNYVDAK